MNYKTALFNERFIFNAEAIRTKKMRVAVMRRARFDRVLPICVSIRVNKLLITLESKNIRSLLVKDTKILN